MLNLLAECLGAATPFFADAVPRLAERFGSLWNERFEDCLAAIWSEDPEGLERAAKAYARFSLESVSQQAAYERDGKYQIGSFEQANAEVYQNKSYMETQYLPGLLLSNYLWPHHYSVMSFFVEQFLPLIGKADRQEFADAGVGTGLFSRLVLTAFSQAEGTAIDLSPHSLAFTARHLSSYGVERRCRLVEGDITSGDVFPGKSPFLICVEVLEHIEDPLKLLETLRKMLAPKGLGFVTAAINAANLDHIYLYRNTAQVTDQLVTAGFKIFKQFNIDAYPSRGNHPPPSLAAFIVG